MTRILDHAFLCLFEVNEHDPEALGIALGPFEVVQKAPEMIGPDRDTVFDRPVQFLQMASQVSHASIVTDATIGVWACIVGAAILGDLDRDAACHLLHPDQDLMQPARIDIPADVRLLAWSARDGCPFGPNLDPWDATASGNMGHAEARVVVEADKIEGSPQDGLVTRLKAKKVLLPDCRQHTGWIAAR